MRKQLRNKEIRYFKEFIKEDILKTAKKIEEYTEKDTKYIIIDNKVVLFQNNNTNNKWVYSLHALLNSYNKIKYKEIVVDKGAIGFVVKGADIMRPGIIEIDSSIKENDFIMIKEELHNKIIAVGKSLINGEEMQSANTGKVVKNLHYVSDEIWNKE
jgi:PUA domain protein